MKTSKIFFYKIIYGKLNMKNLIKTVTVKNFEKKLLYLASKL